MTTPEEYTMNLKAGIITPRMLSDCLYSVSARAKNYRNLESTSYRAAWKDDNRERKEHFYALKEELLSCIHPVCIHRTTARKSVWYYSYESEYNKICESKGTLYDGFYYDRELGEEVYYIDTYKEDYNYFLFYDLGTNHTFHTPIDHPAEYDLPIVDIDMIKSHGENVSDLISMDFVKKVLDFIREHDHKLDLTVPEEEMNL